MISRVPLDLKAVKPHEIDKEILRAAIIAELDAINLYEQMAALASDNNIKIILLDVAKEEKTHVGEFQAALLRQDAQQERELAHGREEVEELTREKQA